MSYPSIGLANDGEVLLEWIHDEYRFGISLDPKGEHSWYLVTTDKYGLMDCGWMNENLKTCLDYLRNVLIAGKPTSGDELDQANMPDGKGGT